MAAGETGRLMSVLNSKSKDMGREFGMELTCVAFRTLEECNIICHVWSIDKGM